MQFSRQGRAFTWRGGCCAILWHAGYSSHLERRQLWSVAVDRQGTAITWRGGCCAIWWAGGLQLSPGEEGAVVCGALDVTLAAAAA